MTETAPAQPLAVHDLALTAAKAADDKFGIACSQAIAIEHQKRFADHCRGTLVSIDEGVIAGNAITVGCS